MAAALTHRGVWADHCLLTPTASKAGNGSHGPPKKHFFPSLFGFFFSLLKICLEAVVAPLTKHTPPPPTPQKVPPTAVTQNDGRAPHPGQGKFKQRMQDEQSLNFYEEKVSLASENGRKVSERHLLTATAKL